MTKMAGDTRRALIRQYETAWKLASFHLDGLSTQECFWRPARVGLHVRAAGGDGWHGDWPVTEGYDIGPPSIAWLTWHIVFWWSMVLDHSFGVGSLTREQINLPEDAKRIRRLIQELEREWRSQLDQISDAQLLSGDLTRWPFKARPFADVVAWVTMELTKNAAEIGYARFMYAADRLLFDAPRETT